MAPVKPSALLADLRTFASNIPASTPYEDLAGLLRDAYDIYPRQSGVIGMADASALVTFDIFAGPRGGPQELLDQVTMRVPAQAGPVSALARAQLQQSLVLMVFGRLPPVPEAVAQHVHDVKMNGHDDEPFELPEDDEPIDEQEYVPAPPAILDIIERYEPDGVPIFKDLYDFSEPSPLVCQAIMVELENFMETAASAEQVSAVMAKNEVLRTYMKDFMPVPDREKLKAMAIKRRGQLEAGVNPTPVPRRRPSAGVN